MSDDMASFGSTPGWRQNPSGQVQWWSGEEWGPFPPPGSESSTQGARSPLAVVAHMGSLFGSFVLPLVIYLVSPKSDDFTRHHAAEGLNWQLTFLLWWLGCFAALALIEPKGPGGALLVLAMIGTFFAGLGLSIAGMVAASRGRWWNYPIRIRFVAGPPRPADWP